MSRGEHGRAVGQANRARVRAAVAAGHATPPVVAEAAGVSRPTAIRHLRALGMPIPRPSSSWGAMVASRRARGLAERERVGRAVPRHLDEHGRIKFCELARALRMSHSTLAIHLKKMPDAPPARDTKGDAERLRARVAELLPEFRRPDGRVRRKALAERLGLPERRVSGLLADLRDQRAGNGTRGERIGAANRVASLGRLRARHPAGIPPEVFDRHFPADGRARPVPGREREAARRPARRRRTPADRPTARGGGVTAC